MDALVGGALESVFFCVAYRSWDINLFSYFLTG